MLNIDTRILDDLTSDQYWLLSHILKRIDADLTCFPSNKKLCEDTRWEIKKLQKIKAELIGNGFLIVKPRKKGDAQTSNEYKVQTDLISVYVPAKKITAILEVDTPPSLFTDTPPSPERDNKVLTHEVLIKEQMVVSVIKILNDVKAKFGIKGQVRLNNPREVLIRNRMVESNSSIEDVRRMIEYKAEEWKGKVFNGQPAEKYLRIETLFALKNFQKYLEEAEAAPDKDWTEQQKENIADQEEPKNKYSGLW